MRIDVIVLVALGLLAAHRAAAQEASREIPELVPGRLEPLVDRHWIAELDGVEHRLHAPQPAGVALRFDRPWEGGLSGYVTVLRAADRWLMYYRGRPVAGNARDASDAAREVTCVAISDDGRGWRRPDLGDGTNVILDGPPEVTHNFAPFVDARPGVPAAGRFKALGGIGRTGLSAWRSADGLVWERMRDRPVITGGAFDSQNVAFWSAHESRYVCYYRVFVDGVRWIARCTSTDFVDWSDGEVVTADGPHEHLYTNQTVPYPRAPHVYVATPARFWPGRRALTPAQAAALEMDAPDRYRGLANGTSDAVLMTSRDGIHFDRTFLESWIRPGRDAGNWVARANYPAHGIHETAPGELSVWVQRGYGQPDARLERLTLRVDGFASLHAGARGGIARSVVLRLGEPTRGVAKAGDPVRVHGDELVFTMPAVVDLPKTRELGNAFTLALRVRDVPAGRRRLFSSYDGGPPAAGELVFDADLSGAPVEADGPLRFVLGGRKLLAPMGVFDREAPGGWRHLAVVWDHGSIRLFADGHRVAAGGTPGAGHVGLEHRGLRLGEDFPPTALDNEALLGRVRDVVVLRRALDAAGIAALAAERRALPDLRIPRGPDAARLRLELNLATSAAGRVRVGVETPDGAAVPGRGVDDCDPILGDDLARVVTWRGDADLADLAGRELRLVFEMQDADLFAFRLR